MFMLATAAGTQWFLSAAVNLRTFKLRLIQGKGMVEETSCCKSVMPRFSCASMHAFALICGSCLWGSAADACPTPFASATRLDSLVLYCCPLSCRLISARGMALCWTVAPPSPTCPHPPSRRSMRPCNKLCRAPTLSGQRTQIV